MRHDFRMSIGAHPGGVGEVNAAFASFAETHDLPAPMRRSISVALDELLANALSHGQAGRETGVVTVEVELDQERLMVTLTDDGPPFDPFGRTAPDTMLSLEEREIGGLGIHLVRRLVDEVSYQRRDGFNVVVLVKQRADGQADGLHGGN
jgi:anti-sigma regulatory factor (Ser/Thr protein kinase)